MLSNGVSLALFLLLLLLSLLLLLLSPHHTTCWLYLSTDAAAMRVEPGQVGRRATNTSSGRTPRVWSRSWAPPAPALYDALRRNTPTCCKQRWIVCPTRVFCQLVDSGTGDLQVDCTLRPNTATRRVANARRAGRVPASTTRPEVSAKLGGVGVWGLRLPLAGTLVAPSGLSSC